ncbi:hypothetical protein R6Q57_017577 [Mikania cordata]
MADELCFSSTCKFNYSFIPSVFFHDLPFLCSFIVSHPLYFSYFIFFSPYLFRFVFFISPLFFTTSILLILSVIATTFSQSKLGFVQTMLDKLHSKMNDVDEDDDFRDFEEFEIYKIVFPDPPLMTVGDGEDEQTVTKSEKERSLEKLFQELDRFEDSTLAIEEDVGELQKLGLVTIISDEDQKSDENSLSVTLNSWRFDSSSSFGSCESIGDTKMAVEMKENETRSHIEEAAGEVQKLEPVKVSFSCKNEQTVQNSFSVKSNSTAAIEMNDDKTISYINVVAGQLQELAPVKVSSFGEDEKTVKNSYSVKINSTTAIKTKENETGSYINVVAGKLQQLEPVKVSSLGEDEKTVKNSFSVKSNSTAAIETKKNETGSRVRRIVQKLEPSAISVSGDDQKSVQSSFSQKSNSWRSDSSSSFGSYGSMRKEKEWKRTLACKLFEERNNSSGGEEGMDSLWEAYEEDNASRKSKNRKQSMINEKKTMNKNKKSSEFKYVDELEDEDDDEDEFMNNGQLCCLKALKLSTGKMNLGMGKPNLVKISKALKGFGWIHHVGSKHGKKH